MPRKKKEATQETASRSKAKAASKPAAKARKAKSAALKPKKPAKPLSAAKSGPKTKTAPALKPKGAGKKNAKLKSAWSPAKYGETQVVAFIRDPNCLFVYWEIAAQKLEQVKAELKNEYAKSRLVLRMFRSREDGSADLIYEIEVNPEDMNRYLPVQEPGGGYYVEVARKTASGKVLVIARSNSLTAPMIGFSAQVEAAWQPAPEMERYLAEELELELGIDNLPVSGVVGGISSAEAQRRRRKLGQTFSSFTNQN